MNFFLNFFKSPKSTDPKEERDHQHIQHSKPEMILKSEATYWGDKFATTHYVEFLDNKKFINSYMGAWEGTPEYLNWEKDSLNIAWRAHICTWAANQALRLEGDFVECGVWYGILSKIICDFTIFQNQNKKFYLFDLWGGDFKNPNEDKLNPHYQNDIFELVKSRFSQYPNVRLVRGLVPDSLETVHIDKIAYLSIDMNGFAAERAALEKYYPKVVSGGIIYFDDYGWQEYGELRKTVSDFFADKPEKLLHFPSGNSIVVKI